MLEDTAAAQRSVHMQYYTWEQDELTAKILKCDNCGGDPACAKVCPTHALEWVDDVTATRARKRAFSEKFKHAFSE